MSDERSVIVFGQVHESEQQFEYFITGLIGALCGYIGQGYTATKLGMNSSTLELIAILLLVISFALSFLRIHIAIKVKKLNAHALDAAEKKGAIMSKFDGCQELINSSTGEIMSPQQAAKHVQQYTVKERNMTIQLAKYMGRSTVVHVLRMVFLFIGFITLLSAKVLRAYI